MSSVITMLRNHTIRDESCITFATDSNGELCIMCSKYQVIRCFVYDESYWRKDDKYADMWKPIKAKYCYTDEHGKYVEMYVNAESLISSMVRTVIVYFGLTGYQLLNFIFPNTITNPNIDNYVKMFFQYYTSQGHHPYTPVEFCTDYLKSIGYIYII